VTEFTGERVIPGQVEDDLWAEHLARYAFAARYAAGKRVLDVGCGTGYGTAELAKTARATTGVDVAPEAIEYATEHYPGVTFRMAQAGKLPFDVASFDLITAFELIEHLDDWRAMLHEVRRVLDRAGVFIVSTPNKLYYAESRGAAGPNPYHRHEFEYAEFRSALSEFFPNVRVLLQDRMESFGFYDPGGADKVEGTISRTAGAGVEANFFVAVCSVRALQKGAAYLYVPQAANLLRERETHISKLQNELAQVRRWLGDATAERDQMVAKHAALEEHVNEKNRWAAELESTLQATQARVVELQEQAVAEQARAVASIAELNEELERKNRWAWELDAMLQAAQARVVDLQEQFQTEQERALSTITGLEATVVERTQWAQDLDAELQVLRGKIEKLTGQVEALQRVVGLARASRWVKAGRVVGLGPDLKG